MSLISARAVRAASSLFALTAACGSDSAAPARPAPPALVEQALLDRVHTAEGERPAIVNFEDMAAVERALAMLEALPFEGTITRRFRHVPALSVQVTQAGLEQLRALPGVTYIQVDGEGGGQLKEAVPAIGADLVTRELGLTGKGVRVAVLDTGVATAHPDLRDAVVAQHCFTQRGCPPSRSYEGTSAEDDHGHGSNVAGIIASRGVVSSRGFAPEAEIVAVKINDRNDRGLESDWVAGLDWVYDHLDELQVRVLNFSVGTSNIYADEGNCGRRHPALARAIENLTRAGVAVFIASGNHGSGTAMPAPGCLPGDAVVVGATYDSALGSQPPGAATYYQRWGGFFANCGDSTTAFDQIACFTNSNARLDIVAPGAAIVSDSLRGRTEAYWGTSQAAPAAAGVAALMLECNPDLTPAEIKRAMVATGVSVVDAKNGLSFPSLRAYEAVREACKLGADEPSEADAGVDASAPEPSDAGERPHVDAGGVQGEDPLAPAPGDEADPAEGGVAAEDPSGAGGGLSDVPGAGANPPPMARPASGGCAVGGAEGASGGLAQLVALLVTFAVRRRRGKARAAL